MKPDDAVLEGGLPAKGRGPAPGDPGKQYAVDLFGGKAGPVSPARPDGPYTAAGVSPPTGEALKTAPGLTSPAFDPGGALRIRGK